MNFISDAYFYKHLTISYGKIHPQKSTYPHLHTKKFKYVNKLVLKFTKTIRNLFAKL